MAHFYASVESTMLRKPRTARGSKKSGMKAHIRSWSTGIWIESTVLEGDGASYDVFRIWETDGSSGNNKVKLLTTITKKAE